MGYRANSNLNSIASPQRLPCAERSTPLSFLANPNREPLWRDSQGNTEAHLAVANRDFELIKSIIKFDQRLITAKNNQDETAADWFREYINNYFNVTNREDIEKLPAQIKKGNFEFIKGGLNVMLSTKLRFAEGNTLLHLAVKYEQPTIVELILKHTSSESINELLNMKNVHGANAEELAITLGNKSPVILKLLQNSKLPSVQLPIVENSTDFLSKPMTIETFEDISKKLAEVRNESDFQEFTPFLTNLCQITYLICHQAYKLLENKDIPTGAKFLLDLLFDENFTEHDAFQLQKNIHNVCEHYKELLQQNQVNKQIKLSSKESEAAWTRKGEDIIYINLLSSNIDFAYLITCFIHESSHLVNSSYDIMYSESVGKNSWNINIESCKKLAKKINDLESKLPEKKLDLLRIQYLLEGKDLSLGSWLAHQNADTFTDAVLGLAAFRWDCARLYTGYGVLSINENKFLQALADYSAGKESPNPTERRTIKARRTTKSSVSQPLGSSPNDASSTTASDSSPQISENNTNTPSVARLAATCADLSVAESSSLPAASPPRPGDYSQSGAPLLSIVPETMTSNPPSR